MSKTSPQATADAAEIYRQARDHITKQKYDDAKTLLLQSLEIEVTAEAAHDMGVISYLEGDKSTAIEYFEKAVETDPSFTQAYKNAAEIFLEEGYAPMALGCYGRAIQADPENTTFKEKFLAIARSSRFTAPNPEMKELYLLCMQDPQLDFSNMAESWFSMLCIDPAFGKIWNPLNKGNYKSFKKTFEKLKDYSALLDPFFITALKRQIRVPEVTYENFLTHLRHVLLEQLDTDERHPDESDFVILAEALAHYCFATEYVFYSTEEETAKVDRLSQSADTEDKLAILACYEPLHKLPDAEAIEKQFSSATISSLIRQQLLEPRVQEDIKSKIESLTETRQGVSTKVKEQYEHAPYPRWTNFARTMYDENIEGYLKDRDADILVAGCGTGHEAIELAYVFSNAKVLAIDLSFASLAYGISKAREFNIQNITFKQADILELGKLEQKFDYIASTGVLHHMEDPEAGWDMLTGLLKPGSLMRVALYSKKTKGPLDNTKAVIKEKGFSTDDNDIRQFRHEAKKLLSGADYKNVTSYIDYYALSECRDLLFHVQEDYFTIPRIRAYLEKSGLEFLGFYVSADTFQLYRNAFPGDPQGVSLSNWKELEKQSPEIFTGMYRLWLRKPS